MIRAIRQQFDSASFAEAGRTVGERALMRAVLEDAIQCLAAETGPTGKRSRLAAQARTWVADDDLRSAGLASRMKAERDEEIRGLQRQGWTHRAIASRFGLSRARVRRICARRDL